MPTRRGTTIGFLIVTALSFSFSVWAGGNIARKLRGLPLARPGPFTNHSFTDNILRPLNTKPSELGLFFLSSPIGLSLACGALFARLWQRRTWSIGIHSLAVICSGPLLGLSAINIYLKPDKPIDAIVEFWISGTMALTGLLILLVNKFAGEPSGGTEGGAWLAATFLFLFQGVLMPTCTAFVMVFDSPTTEGVRMHGWEQVTSGVFLATLGSLYFMLRTKSATA